MTDDRTCPHCRMGTIYYNTAFRRRIMAMLSELGQPHKFAWNVISPLVKNVAGIKTVRNDYTCNSCQGQAFICPHCDQPAKLKTAPKQAETITCQHCSRQSVFRLD